MVPSPVLAGLFAVAMLAGCATSHPCVAREARAGFTTKQPRPGEIPAPPPPEDLGAHVHAAMSCTVDPCEDFYGYACGGYLAVRQSGRNPRYVAAGFDQISDRNRRIEHAILSVASSTKDQSPERAVLGDFYDACMAGDAIASDLDVLAPHFAMIDAITSTESAMTVLASLQRLGVDAFFHVFVTADVRDTRRGLLGLDQPGTPLAIEHLRGLDERSDEYVKAYREYVRLLLEASGVKSGAARTQSVAVLELERALATTARTRIEMERAGEFVVTTFDELGAHQPGFPWRALTTAFEFPGNASVMIVPDYMAQLETVFAAADPATIKAYLRWRTMLRFARDGSVQSRYAARWFEDEVLREVPSNVVVARWAQCVERANTWLPELLAQYYVQLELPPQSRAMVAEITERVRAGFAERIAGADWLDANARAAARAKLEAVRTRIGHPDRWRDYGSVDLDPRDHLGNIVRLSTLEWELALYEVGRLRDSEAWPAPPVEANARYYGPSNTVMLSAGLLQWPVFLPDRPMVVNFAGIGAIAGHEFGHAFDIDWIDRDPTGRGRIWLRGANRRAFADRVSCLVRDLNERRATEGTQVQGDLVRDEAIADGAGLQAAHVAWRTWQAENPADTPAVAGLTDEQLFFLSYAQAHCRNGTAAFERVNALTDNHPEHRVRVNATLGHAPAFAEAFQCEEGSPMHPTRTCEVW